MLRASRVLVRVFALSLLISVPALARYDGVVEPEVHDWFEKQTSHDGMRLCCSIADGHVLQEEEWRVRGGTYQVFIENKWLDVPRDAMVDPGKGTNPIGKPIVWYGYTGGEPRIDCFCPGTMG